MISGSVSPPRRRPQRCPPWRERGVSSTPDARTTSHSSCLRSRPGIVRDSALASNAVGAHAPTSDRSAVSHTRGADPSLPRSRPGPLLFAHSGSIRFRIRSRNWIEAALVVEVLQRRLIGVVGHLRLPPPYCGTTGTAGILQACHQRPRKSRPRRSAAPHGRGRLHHRSRDLVVLVAHLFDDPRKLDQRRQSGVDPVLQVQSRAPNGVLSSVRRPPCSPAS